MEEYTANVEWYEQAGCVRVFAPGKQFGDPYEWAATVVRRGDSVELVGVDKAYTPDQALAVFKALAGQGVKFVEWERHKHGVVRKVRWAVEKVLGWGGWQKRD